MLPTVNELLADQFRAADPLVLAGRSSLDRTVGWVHSSEIFEISPLLAGGELLLTTGLGLAGVDAGTRRHYVREIAARDVAGVAIEVGRTFDTVPPDMIAEASRARLPLIALRTVVPFIELCRSANTAIVSREVSLLRRVDQLTAELLADLGAGHGPARLLARVGAVTDCPLVLTANSGALVAAHGVDDDRSAWAAVDSATATATIRVRDTTWGTLTAGPGSPLDSVTLRAVLARAAEALAPALVQVATPTGAPRRVAARLLADLLGDKQIRVADLRTRLAAAGASGTAWVPVAVDAPEPRIATRLLDSAMRDLGRPAVIGDVHATVYGLVAIEHTATDPVTDVADALRKARAANRIDGVTIVVGEPDGVDAAKLAAALRTTGSALALAVRRRRDGLRQPVFTTRELAADLLVAAIPSTERAHLVRSTLAPLIAWDAAHGTALTSTLDHFLRNGGSATRCAAALHIGRQSLYQRIDRIKALLGYDPTSPELAGTLLLALTAHRLTDQTD
ncbi:PucR family transcriptional regulator [Nocardia camponoti]|uniref:PucR family transcriptional regulator n=1 Tax=Nocardia camponoti TaxID=1616106 RepID=A0A917V654_9NOCA|nr:PucR family transcriptional regulator [Nocardia camponoti]GGK42230.1 PucR family transcriptional regulator [Nocardia camponoti]